MEVRMFTGLGWAASESVPPASKLLPCLHYEVQKWKMSQSSQIPLSSCVG